MIYNISNNRLASEITSRAVLKSSDFIIKSRTCYTILPTNIQVAIIYRINYSLP